MKLCARVLVGGGWRSVSWANCIVYPSPSSDLGTCGVCDGGLWWFVVVVVVVVVVVAVIVAQSLVYRSK